jgi:hypothetical protein
MNKCVRNDGLGKHHLATFIEEIYSDRNHQRMRKQVRESLFRCSVFSQPSNSFL